jgi:hypothetical protein
MILIITLFDNIFQPIFFFNKNEKNFDGLIGTLFNNSLKDLQRFHKLLFLIK